MKRKILEALDTFVDIQCFYLEMRNKCFLTIDLFNLASV
ncbi:MAG: hypothetical protein ACJAVF_000692, partial [Paraglaciecola sp.]